jgi:hypothetical protein
MGLILLLLLFGGFILFFHDIFFGGPRWEWPSFIFIIALPITIFNSNIFGIIFSIIFFRKVKQIIIGILLFTMNLYLSLILHLPIYTYILENKIRINESGYGDLAYNVLFIIGNAISIIIYFCITIFDNIYMKMYFKKLLLKNNDIIFKKINKIKTRDIIIYLNKYKRKEHLLYNNLITKLEELNINY